MSTRRRRAADAAHERRPGAIRFRELGGPNSRAMSRDPDPEHQERFRGGEDVDFSYVSEDGGRFR